jgi:hypothetical protein
MNGHDEQADAPSTSEQSGQEEETAGDRRLEAGGAFMIRAERDIHVKAGGGTILAAGNSMTIESGGGTILMAGNRINV